MTYDVLMTPLPQEESTRPVRVPGEVWTRVVRAAVAHCGLDLERYRAAEARQFAAALRAALAPPAETAPAPARYAVFRPTAADPGAPLREASAREVVGRVIAVFDRGGVLVQRTVSSSLRAIPV
jgi:hypothetical protein